MLVGPSLSSICKSLHPKMGKPFFDVFCCPGRGSGIGLGAVVSVPRRLRAGEDAAQHRLSGNDVREKEKGSMMNRKTTDIKPSEILTALQERGLSPPKNLTVAITGACNLRCRHCWVEAGEASSAASISLPVLVEMAEEFARLGGEGIRFTGGEPLCHPDWLELLRTARVLGFQRVGMQTNGMLLREKDVAALRELDFSGLSIQVSLDGATAPSHDRVRGKGAFDRALRGIRRLTEGGLAPRLTLFFTEMKHNLEELPQVLELAADLGVGSVVAGALVRCGNAAEESTLQPAEVGQYLSLVERYETDPRFRELYGRLGTVAALEWHASGALRSECCTFVENPYLTASGKLYPCVLCHADDFAVTDVFAKGVTRAFGQGAPLWADLLRITRARAAGIARCRRCPGALTCGGGCPGRAWGSSGNFLSAEDRCALRLAIHGRSLSPHSD